ncbi:hypothetical protein TNCV_3632301 [Trichonephila clavipes]|nr:hypothetical protein TNCV_3632301 [Trichonephila clavipes]
MSRTTSELVTYSPASTSCQREDLQPHLAKFSYSAKIKGHQDSNSRRDRSSANQKFVTKDISHLDPLMELRKLY